MNVDPSAPVKSGPIEIDACSTCGSIWFDKGEVEAVPYSRLPDLLPKGRTTVPRATSSACPTCGSLLHPLSSPNLPREVNASFCPACRGTLFSPSDLLKYKKAQISKIAYFKNFHIPIPSSSLLLTGLVGLLLVGTLTVGSFLKNQLDNRARAARLISKPFVTTVAASRVTLTFTTQKPVTSRIEIEAPYIAQPRALPISNTPTALHQITLQDLRSATEYSYRIIIYDEDDIKTTSETFTFRTP